MAQTDMLKRYLDAGIAFTQLTQKRAEAIVRELVKAGEVQTNQTQARVQDLLDRNRENTERLVELIRAEVRSQLSNLGLGAKPVRRAAKAPVKEAPVKKAAAKEAPAAKKAAKKAAPTKKAVKKAVKKA